jgi:hypothetical protein
VFTVRYELSSLCILQVDLCLFEKGLFFFFCLLNCWLEVSTHPEGPATGHLDTGFTSDLLCL